MKTLATFFLLILFVSCTKNKIAELEFLEGTWKREGKERYEFWEKSPQGELIGNAYKMVEDEKLILETLRIKSVEHQVIYGATVGNQNNGKTIEFSLNSERNDCFSFENPDHDFPKKIQYKKISENSIQISVLGEGGKGFSYIQRKQ